MNGAMKKRLIGSIVFGCLAIILIPILLDGEGLRSPELDLDIPESPVIPAIPELQAYRPDIPEDNAEPASALISPASDTISPDEQHNQQATQPSVQEQIEEVAEQQPRLTAEMIPEAWAVRLGVFENKDNATGLKNRLLELGYKAYSRPLTTSVTSSQRELTAVFVGPVLTRTEALSMVTELKQTINEDGVVVEFTINN